MRCRPVDHDTYRRLCSRQVQELPGRACEEFIDALKQLGEPAHIPYFDAISERLHRATGMRSCCKIDIFQAGYYVIDSFEQLFQATAMDFTPIYRQMRGRIEADGEFDAGRVLAGERRFSANPACSVPG